MDKEAGVTPDKENTFDTIRQQIEIEIDSARKFFDNRLFHRALQRYETALRLANRLQEEDFAQLGELGELVYNVEVQRSIIFLMLASSFAETFFAERARMTSFSAEPENALSSRSPTI